MKYDNANVIHKETPLMEVIDIVNNADNDSIRTIKTIKGKVLNNDK